ncbi:response regulator transcription factor [Sporomusa malonica]|uniref:DNA-binding response regulator, OmpR family, contains REC and winged-helix (WHTH) domain n=1 Tax=Sporomusa malonica TaxID=112901 RepID=A0A1W2EJH3_9FIRM|nr:response regulator transcription factor [Sporomusa malonica]SMD09824.1 DNA-binding response regulator, OmpR family, contains REC and winged-helix (wHTH) domain [Sporomusa malonica]
MNLLLVEDEGKLVESLSHLLKMNGFVVDAALDGQTGMNLACTGLYDIIVLDRMLPQQDGISFLRLFRSLGHDTPILVLTAKDSPADRVEGLNAGADDYLTKPFFTDELIARLQTLVRRARKGKAPEIAIKAAGLILDPLRSQVVKGIETFHLTAKEASLLELLMRNCSQVVTKKQISDKIWGSHSKTAMANVDLYIHYLRKKLNIREIRTIRGVGYSLQGDNHVS